MMLYRCHKSNLENTKADDIGGAGVEHMQEQDFLVPFLLMEASVQVQVQDYDANHNAHAFVQKHC